MTVDDVLNAISTFGAPELAKVLDGLCPCFALIPVERLVQLGVDVAKAIEAKNELAEMQAAVKAIDDQVAAAQQADLELNPTGGL